LYIVLIVLAEPTFDSPQDEYWGIDAQSGARLWKSVIPGQGRLTFSEIRSTARSVFQVQCRADPNECSWSDLGPQTGVGSNSGKTSDSGSDIQVTWDRDILYLVADRQVLVMDALGDQLLFQWP
jgi:hypothetical protein